MISGKPDAYHFSHPNKVQSETADFATSAVTWQTTQNIRIVYDSGPFAP